MGDIKINENFTSATSPPIIRVGEKDMFGNLMGIGMVKDAFTEQEERKNIEDRTPGKRMKIKTMKGEKTIESMINFMLGKAAKLQKTDKKDKSKKKKEEEDVDFMFEKNKNEDDGDINTDKYKDTGMSNLIGGEKLADIGVTDKNGRNVIHRAALEQSSSIIGKLFRLVESHGGYLSGLVNAVDNYGNTPLLSSCVYNHSPLLRYEVITLLMEKRINVHQFNPKTRWMAVHWLSHHGDLKALRLLLTNGARFWLPDVNGYFPLDLAGRAGSGPCVKLIIENLIATIDYYNLPGNAKRRKNYVTKGSSRFFLFSSYLHSSMLFWSCYFHEIDYAVTKKLIETPYYYTFSSWKNPIMGGQTAFHAAAAQNDLPALRTLYRDANSFRIYIHSTPAHHRIQRYGICPTFLQRKNVNKFSEETEFYHECEVCVLRFSHANQFRIMHKERNNLIRDLQHDMDERFVCLDDGNNTPMHLAVQTGAVAVVKYLLDQKQPFTKRNLLGWTPVNLTQDPDVRRVFNQMERRITRTLSMRGKVAQVRPDEENNIHPLEDYPRSPDIYPEDKPLDRSIEDTLEENLPENTLVVVKVNIKKNEEKVDRLIGVLTTKFMVRMVPAVGITEKFYLLLSMDEDRMDMEAAKMGLKVKLFGKYSRQAFDDKRKLEFEPFRSQEKQLIQITVLRRIVDLEQAKKEKMIHKYFIMHSEGGLRHIAENWFRGGCSFEPFASYGNYLTEGSHLQYTSLLSISQYFGSKFAFYIAFFSFYTCWLLYIGLLGLGMFIYLSVTTATENYGSPIYAVIVCLWVTIFSERWKRKSTEVATKFGTLEYASSTVRNPRETYMGDEYININTWTLDKRYPKYVRIFYMLVSLPLLFFLLACCIAVFIGTVIYKQTFEGTEHKFIAGIICGTCISVLNIVYDSIAQYFVDQENHKYSDTYEQSLILKIFTFRFINCFISPFYTGFIEQNFDNLYYLLLGLIITKHGSHIFSKYIFLHIKQRLRRKHYFSKILNYAEKQYLSLKRYVEAHYSGRANKKNAVKGAFEGVGGEIPYCRGILDAHTGVQNKTFNIDQVEISSKLEKYLEPTIFYSEIFIQFGYVTLFAAAFPLAPVISILNNIFELRIHLHTYMRVVNRPQGEVVGNIGTWQRILEFMGFTAVVSNCLLIYFTSRQIEGLVDDGHYKLWAIIIVEHIILLLKYFSEAIIEDRPSWVTKEMALQSKQHDKLKKEKDQQFKKNIKEIIARNDKSREAMKVRYAADMGRLHVDILDLQNSDKQNQLILANQKMDLRYYKRLLNNMGVKPKAEGKKGEDTSTSQVEVAVIEVKEPEVVTGGEGFGTTSNFAQLTSSFVVAERATPEQVIQAKDLQEVLTKSFIIKLFQETFYRLERLILFQRLDVVNRISKEIKILCVECESKKAEILCFECKDHFCTTCFDDLHRRGGKLGDHKIEFIHATNIHGKKEAMKKNVMDVIFSPGEETQIENEPQWKKLEYFHFPIKGDSAGYHLVTTQFEYLKDQYIDKNCVRGNMEINMNAYLIRGSEDLISQHQKFEMGIKLNKEVIAPAALNHEEYFFLNRIAFLIFKERGVQVFLKHFIQKIKLLQEGTFEQRCLLLFQLIDEDSDEKISRREFEYFIQGLYIQDVNTVITVTGIVDLIFGESSSYHQIKTKKEMIRIFVQNETISQFLKTVVQFNGQQIYGSSINKLNDFLLEYIYIYIIQLPSSLIVIQLFSYIKYKRILYFILLLVIQKIIGTNGT